MKKILITYGMYGSGHKSIASYIKNYFEQHSDYEVKVLNITDYSNFWGKVSIRFWDFVMAYRTELLFDTWYEIIDHKMFIKYQDKLAKLFFDNKQLRDDIMTFNPDLTIDTHFYGGNIINYYNKKGYTHSKIMSVLTDYAPHYCWLADRHHQDAFVVANEIMKRDLVENYDVDAKKIYAFGIPFDKDKSMNLNSKEHTIKKYKLNPDYLTYVFFGGGSNGSMAYYNYFKALAKRDFNINLIFICGKNEKLKIKCDNFVKENNLKNVKVLGFTTDVYNLLKVADCVISKPGGATVTECCEMDVPMIMIPGYGGQEKYNAKFVKKRGYGVNVRGYYHFVKMVQKTIGNEQILKKWRRNIEKVNKNNSTEKIFKLSEKLLSKN